MRLPGRHTDALDEELAALADGSLDPERRAALEARVAASDELRTRLGEQERAVRAVQAAAVPAPERLRARVAADAGRARRPVPRRRLGIATAVALAAGIVLGVVLSLPAGSPGAPSVVEAAALTTRPATAPAPARDPMQPALLRARSDGVAFPDWGTTLAWPATGVRTDTLSGRSATTVFYRRAGRRVGYTIVSGQALSWPAGAHRSTYDGVEFRDFRLGARTVVTWRRQGHTCVLSGGQTPRRVLLLLAAWKDAGSVGF
jgi:anti-sigma factor RsiW